MYPLHTLSWIRAALIYGTLSTISVARLINVSIGLKKVQDGSRGLDSPWVDAIVAWHIPFAKVELFLALFYDTSVLFRPCRPE